MTRDEVMAMPAGPALDALIVEKVMQRQCHRRHFRKAWSPPPVGTEAIVFCDDENKPLWTIIRSDSVQQPLAFCPSSSLEDSMSALMPVDAEDRIVWAIHKTGSGVQVQIHRDHDEFVSAEADGFPRQAIPLALCRAALLWKSRE